MQWSAGEPSGAASSPSGWATLVRAQGPALAEEPVLRDTINMDYISGGPTDGGTEQPLSPSGLFLVICLSVCLFASISPTGKGLP